MDLDLEKILGKNYMYMSKSCEKPSTDNSTITVSRIITSLSLGQEYYTGEDNSFTLRRKLFGYPQRDSESSRTSRDNSYVEPKSHDTQ